MQKVLQMIMHWNTVWQVPEGKTAQEMIALQKRYLLTFTILMYTIEPNMTYFSIA